MHKIVNYVKNKWMYFAALLFPWLITVIYCLINGIWINGEGNIACGDMLLGTIPGAYALWDKVHTGDSFFYTWSAIGGVDFHTISDGLVSPFTLILLLMPRKMVPDVVQFFMIAKWSICAFSMVFFFYNTKYNVLTKNKKLVSFFLGLSFALGNGIVSYLEYINFMDIIIIFPFLLLLVEGMMEDIDSADKKNVKWYRKRYVWYYLLLTYAIFSFFYIAYQVCIFLAFWFFLQLKSKDTNTLKKFYVFAGTSVLAAVSNVGMFIMEFSLYKTRAGVEEAEMYSDFLSKLLITPAQFFGQLFALQPIAEETDMSPNIYFSVACLAVVLLFPVIKMSTKKKIYLSAMGIFLVASFFFGRLNLIWHMLRIPNGLYNRFMFLFVFFMLFLALLVFDNIEEVKIIHVVVCGIILAVMFVISLVNTDGTGTAGGYVLTMLIMFFVLIMLIFYVRKSVTSIQIINIIVVCGIMELCLSSYAAFEYHEMPASYYGEDGMSDNIADMIKNVSMNPGERITCLYPTPNIGLDAGVNSDAGFLSALNIDNRNLHAALGMGTTSNVMFGVRGGSPLVNSIYNIKYGVGESKMLFSDEEKLNQTGDQELYLIKRNAGLGYMVDKGVLDWDYNDKNCFEFQNDFVHKALDSDDIFHEADVELTCHDYYDEQIEPEEESLSDGIYNYISEIKYGNEYEAKQIDVEVKKDMDLYMYFNCRLSFKVFIFVDGEKRHEDIMAYRQSTYHIGDIKKGQKLTIVVSPMNSLEVGQYSQFILMFADFDEAEYSKAYEKLCGSTYLINEEKSNYISGTIIAEKEGIMMTSIPVSPGFSVYVDGEKNETYNIGGALIGVLLTPGEHKVEFEYKTPYLSLKWLILSVTVLLFIAVAIVVNIPSKKKEEE